MQVVKKKANFAGIGFWKRTPSGKTENRLNFGPRLNEQRRTVHWRYRLCEPAGFLKKFKYRSSGHRHEGRPRGELLFSQHQASSINNLKSKSESMITISSKLATFSTLLFSLLTNICRQRMSWFIVLLESAGLHQLLLPTLWGNMPSASKKPSKSAKIFANKFSPTLASWNSCKPSNFSF